jgi:Response regulator containing CheY-like receiver domain and AraC-type DNA-binding domain
MHNVYKVLLVDDEPYVLEGLREFIDWDKYGFVVCGEATNGDEAINSINMLYPDLVVTDIRMPQRDGLEFIRAAEKFIHHPIKYIILSGYSEFGYIKEAISLEVAAYLLKPVDSMELEAHLLKLKEVLDSQRKFLCAQQQHISLQRYFECLLSNNGSDKQVESLGKANEEKYGAFRLALLSLRIPADIDGTEVEMKEEILISLRAINEDNLLYTLLLDKEGRFFLFLPETLSNMAKLTQWIKAAGEYIRKKNGWKMKAYISSCGTELRELLQQYREVLNCQASCFYDGAELISFTEKIKNKEYKYKIDSEVIDWKQSFEVKNNRKCTLYFRKIFTYFKEENIAPGIVYNSVLRLAEELKWPVNHIYRQIMQWDYRDLQEEVFKLCEYQTGHTEHTEATPQGVAVVLDYIRANYRSNLKLGELSRKFYFNTNYLGKALTKTTGMPLTSYIHTLRIEEAKQLLLKNELQISEIAARLGYRDSEYFAEKFKEFENITPSAYRRRRLSIE